VESIMDCKDLRALFSDRAVVAPGAGARKGAQ
jgi:hypothetical protein